MNDDFDVIFSYSRADAIADGVLIDATETAKKAGIRYPLAITARAFGEYVAAPDGVAGQDERGRLWDVVWMLRIAMRHAGPGASTLEYALLVRNDDEAPKPVTLKAVCGPDDDGAPCLTVMMPDEY